MKGIDVCLFLQECISHGGCVPFFLLSFFKGFQGHVVVIHSFFVGLREVKFIILFKHLGSDGVIQVNGVVALEWGEPANAEFLPELHCCWGKGNCWAGGDLLFCMK